MNYAKFALWMGPSGVGLGAVCLCLWDSFIGYVVLLFGMALFLDGAATRYSVCRTDRYKPIK